MAGFGVQAGHLHIKPSWDGNIRQKGLHDCLVNVPWVFTIVATFCKGCHFCMAGSTKLCQMCQFLYGFGTQSTHGPSGSAAWWQRGLDLLPLHLAFLQGLAPHPFSIPLIFLSLFKGFFFPKNFLPPFFQRFSWNLCSKAKAFLPKPFSQRLLSKTCFCPLVLQPFFQGLSFPETKWYLPATLLSNSWLPTSILD